MKTPPAGAAFHHRWMRPGAARWPGPVAAAVVLDPARMPPGLGDSKALTARQRDRAFDTIMAQAQVGIGQASVEEIDRLNILRASHLAMCRALAALPIPPDHALIDGNLIPRPALPGPRGGEGRRALPVDRRGLDRGQGDARPDHGGFGATVPRLRLGGERRLSDKGPPAGAARSGGDPTRIGGPSRPCTRYCIKRKS
jgi:hypothetical protein